MTVSANQNADGTFGFQTPEFNLEGDSTYSLSFDVRSHYNVNILNYCYLMNTQYGNIRLDSNINVDSSGKTTRVKFTFHIWLLMI